MISWLMFSGGETRLKVFQGEERRKRRESGELGSRKSQMVPNENEESAFHSSIREIVPGLRGCQEGQGAKKMRRFGLGPLQGKCFRKVEQGKRILSFAIPPGAFFCCFELRKKRTESRKA